MGNLKIEDLRIINTEVLNKVVLARILKDGSLSMNLKEVTDEVLAATLTHIHMLQKRGEAFGVSFPTHDGDLLLTVVPLEKRDVVKIAAGKYELSEEDDPEDRQIKHDLNRAYEVVSDQLEDIKSRELEKSHLDNFIDYLVDQMNGDRVALEEAFMEDGEA
ncbi:hypothetical protein [Exiguobacterium sp. s181]|uniref:DUF7446 family protein n=1 Tax=Exiguobacterium sp. s181 TaxID=2751288 RepID=UPI001BE7E287|nr:hypothetical protein [Exiguobacterium sp. s181]